LDSSIAASVLPGSRFILLRALDPSRFSNRRDFSRNREIEKMAASIPEKKALNPRKMQIRKQLTSRLFI
jgi:hypothetical protein